MPGTIIARTVIATKMASGTVQLRFQDSNGTVEYEFVIPAADFTSLNTTVNGGATGATLTFNYGQDANKSDFDNSYYQVVT
jgi:hypothetical protein